jgi:hypothetical protein
LWCTSARKIETCILDLSYFFLLPQDVHAVFLYLHLRLGSRSPRRASLSFLLPFFLYRYHLLLVLIKREDEAQEETDQISVSLLRQENVSLPSEEESLFYDTSSIRVWLLPVLLDDLTVKTPEVVILSSVSLIKMMMTKKMIANGWF